MQILPTGPDSLACCQHWQMCTIVACSLTVVCGLLPGLAVVCTIAVCSLAAVCSLLPAVWGVQELKREQMEEQRRAAAAARQELKEDKKPKQTAAGPAPSMALRTQASLQRALSNDDDGMFWDYGQAAGLRAGVCLCHVVCSSCPCRCASPALRQFL